MEKSNKNIMVKSTIGIVVGVVAYFLVKQFLFPPVTFDKAMMEAASELNKSCPITVDAETRLDNAVALPDNIFQYNYTLINYAREELDIEVVKSNIQPGIINNVKTNPDLSAYREHKVTIAYYYKDKNSDFLFKILVGPDLYD
jgi:hypothetical protein